MNDTQGNVEYETICEYNSSKSMDSGGSREDNLLIRHESYQSNTSSDVPLADIIKLKKKLRFFFKNPIEKWQTRRRFPYKFFIQVVKIVLVTIQLCTFGASRYNHLTYSYHNQISFCHLFLKGWDVGREVMSYPPEAGPFALYRIHEFYESIDFAVNNFSNLSNALGPYVFARNKTGDLFSPYFCYFYVPEDIISPEEVDYKQQKECKRLPIQKSTNFSIERFLKDENTTLNFTILVRASLTFAVESITYRPTAKHCNEFIIKITYDNSNFDGQMLLSLKSTLRRNSCKHDMRYAIINRNERTWEAVFDYLVIIICFISLILCSRAVLRAQTLKYTTMKYYKLLKKRDLSNDAKLQFWNFWYILIIVNDILIIIGSYLQQKITKNEFSSDDWSLCSLALGIGNMLVWLGVLRYFEFFRTYNVVMLTLRCAFPKMARFLLCALIIYAGFVFCGWLVLGPFHMKFRTLSSTSECLFSLINGDDMFATFSTLESNSLLLWWYCRIYIYTFISLFIYVVLSLFLSVIIDAYETIKDYYKNGFPVSDLQEFIDEPLGNEDMTEGSDNNEFTENNRHGYIHGPWCFLKSFLSVVCFCNRYKVSRNRNVEENGESH